MSSILFENISYLDENYLVQEKGFVGVRDGKIVYIGSDKPKADYDQYYQGSNRLLLPGFYNTHTHLAMSLLRGYGADLPLQAWLFDKVFPFEAKLDSNAIYWGNLLGVAEALRFGIVSATDMYMDSAAICQGVMESGFKINAALMAPVGIDSASQKEFPFDGAAEMLAQYQNAGNGRIIIDAYIHSEYTTNPEHVSRVREFAEKYDLNIHVHISETKLEHEECKSRRDGKTPVAYFADLGVFDRPTTAAHCVWVDDADIAILADKKVSVAHNPVSNLKLASGICPVTKLLARDVNVALGTDSVSSNNNLNMLEEIKLMAMLQKVATNNANALSCTQVLQAATLAGVKAQGRKNTGSIKLGNQADLIVIDIDQPYYYPRHDMLAHVVYAGVGTDVVLTIVDGEILYKHGEYTTIDIERVTREAEKAKNQILAKL